MTRQMTMALENSSSVEKSQKQESTVVVTETLYKQELAKPADETDFF